MGARRVLVTGCSSGIGLAVAARLAKDEFRRFKVVATMRDLGKRGPLERAAGDSLNKTLEIKQLDACCEASIRECVDSLPDRRVDILVSNAGIGMIGPLECQSIAAMKELFDTNFFGLARLVKEVLPDMKRRKNGHIVVMSSVMGIQGLLFNDVYSASKFAVEGFCESLAVQAMKFNIKTTLVEPGPVVTEFERKVYEDAEKMDLSGTDEETAKIFREVYLPYSKKVFASLGQTPEEVAKASAVTERVERSLKMPNDDTLVLIVFFLFVCFFSLNYSANSRSDRSQGSPSAPPDQPLVHAHDHTETCRPNRPPATGHLL
uniref:Zmp:0000001048 n=1 Tax=Echeneis naucrates TaxID=173247 RepID=A0A665XF27_ECHNA